MSSSSGIRWNFGPLLWLLSDPDILKFVSRIPLNFLESVFWISKVFDLINFSEQTLTCLITDWSDVWGLLREELCLIHLSGRVFLILFHESLLNPVLWVSPDSLCVMSLSIQTFSLRGSPKISTCSTPWPFSLHYAVDLQLLPFVKLWLGVVLSLFSYPDSRVRFLFSHTPSISSSAFQLHFYHRLFFFDQPFLRFHSYALWNYTVRSGFVK